MMGVIINKNQQLLTGAFKNFKGTQCFRKAWKWVSTGVYKSITWQGSSDFMAIPMQRSPSGLEAIDSYISCSSQSPGPCWRVQTASEFVPYIQHLVGFP